MIYVRRAQYLIISIFAVIALADIGINSSRAEGANLFEQQKLMSHLLINAFLEKVSKEDLSVFGHVVDRSDLLPHHVSYVHDLEDDELKAELCFKLTKQIPVPNFEGYYVERLIVEMDSDGRIIEVSTHVSPIEQEAEENADQDQMLQ